jgi:glycosyltransferase involved in cell wall biosynthesis
MASGVPLVTTTGGALPEVVGEDGVTGRLVAPADPGALALAIGGLFEDQEMRSRLADAARRRILERFTWKACAASTAEHYRWVIDRHQSVSC